MEKSKEGKKSKSMLIGIAGVFAIIGFAICWAYHYKMQPIASSTETGDGAGAGSEVGGSGSSSGGGGGGGSLPPLPDPSPPVPPLTPPARTKVYVTRGNTGGAMAPIAKTMLVDKKGATAVKKAKSVLGAPTGPLSSTSTQFLHDCGCQNKYL